VIGQTARSARTVVFVRSWFPLTTLTVSDRIGTRSSSLRSIHTNPDNWLGSLSLVAPALSARVARTSGLRMSAPRNMAGENACLSACRYDQRQCNTGCASRMVPLIPHHARAAPRRKETGCGGAAFVSAASPHLRHRARSARSARTKRIERAGRAKDKYGTHERRLRVAD